MDVQQLFTSLSKEAECPLCLETVKDPKTLPCLHSFCLRCIDKNAGYAKRKLEATIKCPVCQACFQIPEGDSFGGLPTSFHLNRLVDLLALRDGSEETQRCSSCEDNNTATCYCFNLFARTFFARIVLTLISAWRPREVIAMFWSIICKRKMWRSWCTDPPCVQRNITRMNRLIIIVKTVAFVFATSAV